MELKLIRTNSKNRDFIELVEQLDNDLTERDGADHSFYAQFNFIGQLNNVVVAYVDGNPIGCGAFKEMTGRSVEIKRMYTNHESRGKGVASTILKELENWACERSYQKCLLETGKRQPEAISLYKKRGYKIIPNYCQYVGIDNSLCFEKILNRE